MEKIFTITESIDYNFTGSDISIGKATNKIDNQIRIAIYIDGNCKKIIEIINKESCILKSYNEIITQKGNKYIEELKKGENLDINSKDNYGIKHQIDNNDAFVNTDDELNEKTTTTNNINFFGNDFNIENGEIIYSKEEYEG